MTQEELIVYLQNRTSSSNHAKSTIAYNCSVSEKKVDAARRKVNADGLFKISSGRGGGLSISVGPEDELSVYKHFRPELEEWAIQNIYGRHGVTKLILGETHKTKLSGKWSTPDFSMICVHKFLHAPGAQLDVVSIEIKHTSKQFDVSCVYEALAHTRVSAFSFLCFYDPLHERNVEKHDGAVLEDIKSECATKGIGLVISQYPTDVTKWHYLVPARRLIPDKRRVDAFIEEAFSHEQHKELKKLL